MGMRPLSILRMARTSSTPPAWGRRKSRTRRSTCARSSRTWASSSAALLTVRALCPAPTSAVAKRSRTKAVSSATITVLLLTGLDCAIYQVLVIIRTSIDRIVGACMASCPECDAEIEVDEFDVDKGDLISCPDCGSNLEVTSTSPIELDLSDEDDEDDDDDDAEESDEEGDDVDEDDDDEDDDDAEKEDWDE